MTSKTQVTAQDALGNLARLAGLPKREGYVGDVIYDAYSFAAGSVMYPSVENRARRAAAFKNLSDTYNVSSRALSRWFKSYRSTWTVEASR